MSEPVWPFGPWAIVDAGDLVPATSIAISYDGSAYTSDGGVTTFDFGTLDITLERVAWNNSFIEDGIPDGKWVAVRYTPATRTWPQIAIGNQTPFAPSASPGAGNAPGQGIHTASQSGYTFYATGTTSEGYTLQVIMQVRDILPDREGLCFWDVSLIGVPVAGAYSGDIRIDLGSYTRSGKTRQFPYHLKLFGLVGTNGPDAYSDTVACGNTEGLVPGMWIQGMNVRVTSIIDAYTFGISPGYWFSGGFSYLEAFYNVITNASFTTGIRKVTCDDTSGLTPGLWLSNGGSAFAQVAAVVNGTTFVLNDVAAVTTTFDVLNAWGGAITDSGSGDVDIGFTDTGAGFTDSDGVYWPGDGVVISVVVS